VNGLLVPPRDPEALAARLSEALQDRALRQWLEQGARDASPRYDVDRCVEQMQDLYDEVLRERGLAA
jgi:glycosyltransferase involved in cell wall biosynthesis